MGLNWNEIKSRALLFSKTWADACNEDSQAKPFWIDFFEIFGITNKRVATFELNVKKLGGAQGFVDLFWPGVLLVEHKSRGKSLDDAVDQAIGYLHNLPERDLPQLVVVCDFARFRVRRLATGETVEFELKHLHKHVKLFGLLAGYKVQDIRSEDPVNIKAAERMGRLHDALKASGYSGHALEVLLVRLLFCLFADDTGIFQPAQSFRDFVEERTAPDGSDLGPRLGQLFQVLNTHGSQRSKNIDEQLGQFAYINGRLFEETLPMADFSTAMREALLDACALDWSAISPAIFGSLFQSIMDEKARRNLGAHYTSEANILKLIKPLFLDELHAEFERVKGHRNKLFEFHKKLRQLTFFDPACGCGNFLVITQAAFVSTNSITQGEQVAVLWGEMQRLGMHTHFAHRTFQWTNEASGKAAVHCVIVGFGPENQAVKTIFEYEDIKGLPHAVPAKRINAYLVDAPDVLMNKRRTPICAVPEMTNGSKPTDGGHLLLDDAEKESLIKAEPQAAPRIRPFMGAEEFINKTARWCLWLVDCPPKELRLMPEVMKRVQAVKAMRLASTDKQTQQDAGTPTQFQKIRQPASNYLLIPSVSSERRNYVPIGFMDAHVIVSNLVYAVPDATLFHFGVMTSSMHNAFMRFTCGRLESRFRYSNTIVYNNYPWPGFAGDPLSDKHRTAIEQAAQCVLDARAQFASSSLADLYDPLTMPPALLKAHQKLDTAVDAAYQPSGGKKTYASDAERVAFLFELYQRITSLLPATAAKKTPKSKATER